MPDFVKEHSRCLAEFRAALKDWLCAAARNKIKSFLVEIAFSPEIHLTKRVREH